MATTDNQTADTAEKIFIGKGEQSAWLTLALANRHGLVTGATGTGKTVSLQVMAEGFARAGVPVFAVGIAAVRRRLRQDPYIGGILLYPFTLGRGQRNAVIGRHLPFA